MCDISLNGVVPSGPDAIVAGLTMNQGSSSKTPASIQSQLSLSASSSSQPIVIDLTDLDSDDESSQPLQQTFMSPPRVSPAM